MAEYLGNRTLRKVSTTCLWVHDVDILFFRRRKVHTCTATIVFKTNKVLNSIANPPKPPSSSFSWQSSTVCMVSCIYTSTKTFRVQVCVQLTSFPGLFKWAWERGCVYVSCIYTSTKTFRVQLCVQLTSFPGLFEWAWEWGCVYVSCIYTSTKAFGEFLFSVS